MIDWKDCAVHARSNTVNVQFSGNGQGEVNPHRKGSMIWSLMEGKCNGMTVSQIADAFNASEKSVKAALWKIHRDTPKSATCVGAASPFPSRKKQKECKCSTCANQECRVSGKACNWLHCKEWRGYDE